VKVEERVRYLMALALDAGANQHEARNAAMQALRLIAQHKLLDSVAPPVSPPHKTPDWASPESYRPPPIRQKPRPVRVHVHVVRVDEDLSGMSPDQVQETLEDIFAQVARPPEHTVATSANYPQPRVIQSAAGCAGCGGRIPSGSLVTVDLDDYNREVAWHRPCWNRGKHG
jgi:Protein of unknown function (DUF2786)